VGLPVCEVIEYLIAEGVGGYDGKVPIVSESRVEERDDPATL